MRKKRHDFKLQTHIYRSFLVNSLVAILFISIISTIVYAGALFVSKRLIVGVFLDESIEMIETRTIKEKEVMEAKLKEVERLLIASQAYERAFFESLPSLPVPETDIFAYHDNGVFYKPKDNGGASLYYSSDTVIDDAALKKAYYSETFDIRYKSIVDSNPFIGQMYINTYDNMNRLYPYMQDAPGQYGPIVKMMNHDFYRLADKAHNPSGGPVWTKAYLDPAGMGWVVSCIVPIYNDGFLEGVTGVDITVRLLIDHFMNIEDEVLNGILVTDDTGDIIAMNEDIQNLFDLEELTVHEYTTTIEKTIYKPEAYAAENLPEPFKSMIAQELSLTSFEVDGKKYHIERRKMNTTGWELLVVIDEAMVTKKIDNINAATWKILRYEMLIIVVLIIGYIIMFRRKAKSVSKYISEPIEKLSMAVNQFGKTSVVGKLEGSSQIHEINALYERFEEMLNELNKRTAELIEKETEKQVQQRLTQKYKKKANEDALTGLNNRSRVDDRLNDALNKSMTEGSVLSLILIDIDDFKKINDNFGHLIGDQVLADFARILKATIGAEDIAGRWGGEEFLVICPGKTAPEALGLADGLRMAVQDHDFDLGRKVTASFGVAQYKEGDDRRALFERVDMAMYQAKGLSKNVVVNGEEGRS